MTGHPDEPALEHELEHDLEGAAPDVPEDLEAAPDVPEDLEAAPGSAGYRVHDLPVLGDDVDDVAVAALADRLANVDRKRRQERAAEELAARATSPTPCRWCGSTWSEAGWFDGPTCASCDSDRRVFGTGAIISDREHRALVAWRLVNAISPAEAALWRPELLAERSGFKWWHETPGAPPGGRVRFHFVDARVLLERLLPSDEGAPTVVTGPPCDYCGSRRYWVRARVAGAAGSVAFPPQVLTELTCLGPCFRLGQDLDVAAARVVGMVATRGLGQALGVAWWQDHLAGLPLRQRLRARRNGPDEPLAWWPSKGQLQARAWRLAGLKPGDFPSEVQTRWETLQAMRDAEQAAAVEALADAEPAEVE
jgi:hypothetical protein